MPSVHPGMLLVVNPAASTYSRRLEAAVARELARAFEVDLVHSEEPGHAVALSRAGAGEDGVAAVAVLGGDGAVNEAANGLAGTDIPLLPLPAGRTNVLCRSLGFPADARRAAAAFAEGGGAPSVRRIDLGTMNERVFTFASSIGLPATANRRLTARGAAGRRLGGYLFVYDVLAEVARQVRRPPRLAVVSPDGGDEIEGVTVVAQNADPLSYLGSRPLPLCAGAGLETGTISLAVLRRVSAGVAAGLTPRILLGRGSSALRHDAVASAPAVAGATVRTVDGRPLPVEVDGDYVGELEQVSYGARPRALAIGVPARAPRG